MGADEEGEREALSTGASGPLEADSGRVSSVVEPCARWRC